MTMQRDASGRFTPKAKEEVASAPTKELDNYGFYSKLLKKPFDSLEELRKEEEEYHKVHAVELKKAEERKTEAKEIENLIKARDEIAAQGLQRKKAAAEKYSKTEQEARKEYMDECNAVEAANREACSKLDDKLKAFCQKNPGGYHATIRYDDGSTKTYSYNINTTVPVTWNSINAFDLIDRMFKF